MKQYVNCPRCGRRIATPSTFSEVTCNCHEYCSEGSKPSDCTMTRVTWQSPFNYPSGMHVSSDSELDAERPSHLYYCSVHERYSDKDMMLIEVDRTQPDRRASPRLRDFGEGIF